MPNLRRSIYSDTVYSIYVLPRVANTVFTAVGKLPITIYKNIRGKFYIEKHLLKKSKNHQKAIKFRNSVTRCKINDVII